MDYYDSPLLKIKRSPLTPSTVTGSWAGALPSRPAFSLKSCEKVSPGMTSPSCLPSFLFFFPGKISFESQGGVGEQLEIEREEEERKEEGGRKKQGLSPATEWEVCLHNACHSLKSLTPKEEKKKKPSLWSNQVVRDTALQEKLWIIEVSQLTRSMLHSGQGAA